MGRLWRTVTRPGWGGVGGRVGLDVTPADSQNNLLALNTNPMMHWVQTAGHTAAVMEVGQPS